MNDLYIGKKLYYLNKVYQTVFCKIKEMNEEEITIITEYGRIFKAPSSAIEGYRINPFSSPKKDTYLKCLCGCIKFEKQGENLICEECRIEYKLDELNQLKPTEYIEKEEKILH